MIDNVAPEQVWQALQTEKLAQLVDVRTEAEWNFVGLPDLSAAGKQAIPISWMLYPNMTVNPDFVPQMRKVGLEADHHIFFLCRSGARSRAAAEAALAAGFPNVYNIADGFEGDMDAARHRGQVSGWKARGLPWFQR